MHVCCAYAQHKLQKEGAGHPVASNMSHSRQRWSHSKHLFHIQQTLRASATGAAAGDKIIIYKK
jgi:hypothetical protein